MGRKKKRASADPRARIFCYYCERNFQTEQMLLTHQREKHLRCPSCHKKMLSVQSLTVHVSQMHNYNLTTVPNALPERADVSVEVLGMNGIPESYYGALNDGTSNKAARTNFEQRHPRQQSSGAWGYSATQIYPQQLQYPYQNGSGAYHALHGAYPNHSYPSYSHPQSAYSHLGSEAPYSNAYAEQHAQYSYAPTLSREAHVSKHPAQLSYAQPLSTSPPVQPLQAKQPAVVQSEGSSVKAEANNNKKDVKVVFDNVVLSMEELRAKLPRYKVS